MSYRNAFLFGCWEDVLPSSIYGDALDLQAHLAVDCNVSLQLGTSKIQEIMRRRLQKSANYLLSRHKKTTSICVSLIDANIQHTRTKKDFAFQRGISAFLCDGRLISHV
jgi:hypothetical protein